MTKQQTLELIIYKLEKLKASELQKMAPAIFHGLKVLKGEAQG